MYPLHLACHGSSPNVVACILRNPNAEVNIRDREGKTPLHHACASGHYEIVEQLLRHPECHRRSNETSLHKACDEVHSSKERIRDCVRVLQLLLDHPFILISEKDRDYQTPFDIVEKAIRNITSYYMELLKNHVLLQKFMSMEQLPKDFATKRRWNAYQSIFDAVGDPAVLINGQDTK